MYNKLIASRYVFGPFYVSESVKEKGNNLSFHMLDFSVLTFKFYKISKIKGFCFCFMFFSHLDESDPGSPEQN